MTGAAVMAADADKPAAKKPRVFFVEPKNNATVTSPVHMKFGSEGSRSRRFRRARSPRCAREWPTITWASIRTACRAGKNIVKGTPSWVHFGDGKDVFETQLTPGKHKLALQLGDDKHDTMPGTCEVITVDVKP
jgi:hypothetical protein